MGVKLRWIGLGAALLALASVGVAMAAAGAGGSVKAAKNSKFGSLIVSSTGMTLYHYTPDKHGQVKCTGQCASFWPPLIAAGGVAPKAGPGITASKLSTVKRPDGKMQVTYAGFPLYRFSGDKKAGDVKGQGFEKIWFAVTAKGTLAKAVAAAPSGGGTGTTPTPTTTDPGGYGY